MAEKKEKEEEKEEKAGTAKEASAPVAEEKSQEDKPKAKAAPKKTAKSAAANDLIETIKNMTVLELSELVKEMEEVFGVTAAAPVAVAAGGAAAGGGAPAEEEKSSFDVILSSVGDKKIQVIKVVRSLTGLGLKEAKAVVDEAPKPVKESVNKEEAEKMKKELEEAGATIELK